MVMSVQVMVNGLRLFVSGLMGVGFWAKVGASVIMNVEMILF